MGIHTNVSIRVALHATAMSKQPPFPREFELNKELQFLLQASPTPNTPHHLPGHPRINLDDTTKLTAFLAQEFLSKDMERMAPHLWMMSTQSHANISALHRQKVKRREVVVTQDPKLHLVWIYDRIFIKPLPKYLLSHVFWEKYLLSDVSPLGSKREQIRAAALGYLRTYFYLVKYESDFTIAQDDKVRLIPEEVDWQQFCHFTAGFEDINDLDVSERYHYGELRLTRLNFYSKFFLRKFHYQRMYYQYGAYFARFYGPLLFAFGILSVLLSSMQVVGTIEQISSFHWTSLWVVCRWFSVVSIISLGILSLGLILLLGFKIISEWRYALNDRYWKPWRKTKRRTRFTKEGPA
jgi:hypothetical protein